MSTDMNSVAGKARTLGVNTWLLVLGVALLILGLNVGYAMWKGNRLWCAASSASQLQVRSQQLAVQGQEAVGGDADAFAKLRDTKATVDQDIAEINGNFGDT